MAPILLCDDETAVGIDLLCPADATGGALISVDATEVMAEPVVRPPTPSPRARARGVRTRRPRSVRSARSAPSPTHARVSLAGVMEDVGFGCTASQQAVLELLLSIGKSAAPLGTPPTAAEVAEVLAMMARTASAEGPVVVAACPARAPATPRCA